MSLRIHTEPGSLLQGLQQSVGAASPAAHLIGVCGSGMKALAEFLLQGGWTVSGSDLNPATLSVRRLIDRGLRFSQGHAAQNLSPETSLVVYSAAVPLSNPERQAAADAGKVTLSYAQVLGRLSCYGRGICIAGTHGKSTATAMTANIFGAAGRNPSLLMGAEFQKTGQSGWCGQSDFVVLESCEFQRSFHELHPHAAVILNIETDHFDCYSQESELVDAFAEFARKVPRQGVLVGYGLSTNVRQACQQAEARLTTFGETSDCDWWAADMRREERGQRFRIYRRNAFVCEISLAQPGRPAFLNAIAAAAVCGEMGLTGRAIREGLESFEGLRRRLEHRGSWRGATLVDDYAHHPTAITETLATLRGQSPGRRILCAFQPHQISRTIALMEEFAKSLSGADRVYIPPIYSAREAGGNHPSELSEELALRVQRRGVSAMFCRSLEQVSRELQNELQPGDILLTMGAGDIDQVQNEFTRRLSRNSAQGRTLGPLYVAEAGGAGSVLPYSA